MKRILFVILFACASVIGYSQTTYYWVGSGTGAANNSISTLANWNTAQNGTGSPRVSSTGASDILIFDGANLGGATPVTGPVTVNANASITCAQMKFTGNVTINMIRGASGTSTLTLAGETGEDFVIEAGSTYNVPSSTSGSLRFAMAAANTGRVSGTISVISGQQFRFDNTTSGLPGSFIFTSGSAAYTNITAASSSYMFGSSSQSSERWVVFESGSQLYYDGGYSPVGSGTLYSAIDMKPGSIWHHRATNAITGFGNFFNRKTYGHIIVENNAILTALGPVFQIGNLTITSGSSFITASSGQTAIVGNLLVDGSLSGPAAGTNELLFSGTATQTVSGTGTINVNSLIVGDNANVVLSKNVGVDANVTVYGKMNFGTSQITGGAAFKAEGIIVPVTGTANTLLNQFFLTGNVSIPSSARGQRITGAGIPANTVITGFSSSNDSIYISNAATVAASAVPLSVKTSGAVLITANTGGFDPATGSVISTGTRTYADSVSYTINATTATPFGVTTGSTATSVHTGFVEINANVTTNKGFDVNKYVLINGKLTLRPLDTLHVLTGATINGSFGATKYIATNYNSVNGDQSIVQYDGMTGNTLLPIGTINNYLPVSLNPSTASNFALAVFEGITTNGTITGTPLSPAQKQTVVDAVWNVNRLTGSGNAGFQLGWTNPLEGSTFTTLPSSDIGLIRNTGSNWTLPTGVGDNTLNTVTATVSAFGAFSAGAVPPTIPFIFNPLPVKTYGDADFNGGATSLNTTQPIVYSSSNTSVATIVGGNIHIVGAGTSNITASQVSDGFYPAASITQPLTVNKANLTITADNKTKFEQQPNPTLTATYSGFVLGETPAVLLTPLVLATTATTGSAPGTYPITVSGATAANYNITFVNGTLTVQPKQNQTITFNALPVKTYGNPDFAAGATSTNNTIPITYTSSNISVATIAGSNIHIVGAGTTNITASQAGSVGYFPAPDVTRALIVNKANLTIRVRDTTKVEGQPNPPFTITYTGFVLGESVANLITPPIATTAAMDFSSAGYYPITLSGATSNNYNITYVNGRLTIFPLGGVSDMTLNAYMSNSTTLTVRVFSPAPALGDVMLFDMSGRPLLRKNLFMPAGFISMDIPVASLPAGIYTVWIKGDNVDLKKFVRILK
jgi:hypothetical protein